MTEQLFRSDRRALNRLTTPHSKGWLDGNQTFLTDLYNISVASDAITKLDDDDESGRRFVISWKVASSADFVLDVSKPLVS